MNRYVRRNREAGFEPGVFSAERRRRARAIRRQAVPANATGARYSAILPIMVLAFRDNHQAAVTIEPGTGFEVVGPAPDDRFFIVQVDGEEFLVFTADVDERSTRQSASESATTPKF